MLVEVCVETAEGAFAAEAGGADRVELCADLAVDGLTPSAEVVGEVVRRLQIPVHVLVRPVAGGFVYDEAGYEAMRHGVAMAKDLGAAGVVIGANRPDGTVDVEGLAALVELARPLSVTVHKAFDFTVDPLAALDALIGLGVDRVLTSGQAASAREGLGVLERLVRRSAGRIVVLAGGRIRIEDLPDLARAGLREIHVGSAAMLGGVTDAGQVRRVVQAARGLPG